MQTTLPKKHQPLVSIVILNWNGIDDTLLCLEHVRRLDYKNYEIIVLDNDSTRDESRAILKKQKDITLIFNPKNTGFAGGHIDALPHCHGEYILLLNNDAILKKNYLTEAIPYFEKDLLLGAMGGRSYFWNEEAKPLDEHSQFYGYQTIDVYTAAAQMQTSDHGTIQEVNNLSGSAVIVRRSILDDIGYLYRPFFLYFEETDLFARFKRAGYKTLYNPRLMIWHKNGASSGSSAGSHTFFYYIFRNRFIFAVRNFETHFLIRFFWSYLKISLRSLLYLLLKPQIDPVMHRAYVKAAFWNFFHLPHSLFLRYQLTKQLGPSHYNQQLLKEQNGISAIIDCRHASKKELERLTISLRADTEPLREYVLLVNNSHSGTNQPSHIRFIVDKGYFNVHPVNIACLAACFEWMVISDYRHLPDIEKVQNSLFGAIKHNYSVIAYASDQQRLPFISISKSFYEHIGGFGEIDNLQDGFNFTTKYAQLAKKLTVAGDKNLPKPADQPFISNAMRTELLKKIAYDNQLVKEAKQTRFEMFLAKHYRFYQLHILFVWLGAKTIPRRLKLGRIKQVLLCLVSLNLKGIAAQIKHMRNEVIIYVHHTSLQDEKKIISTQLNYLLQNNHFTEIPVFIICRDRVEPLKKLLAWLQGQGMKKIILIDNDSVYPPLVDHYETSPHQILPLLRNIGHTAPWKIGIIRCLVPDQFYIISDPDVIPTNDCPQDAIKHFLALHKKYKAYDKVGFSLKIDDLPDSYPLKKDVVQWESQFWQSPLDDECFEAGVDTTFALYKPFTYRYRLHPSIRTNQPYSAHHLPWYTNPKNISNEESYYRYRANTSISSWNTDTLPTRYEKEMKKAK